MTQPAPFVSQVMEVEKDWIDYNGHMNMAYYNVLFDRSSDEAFDQMGLGADYARERKLTIYDKGFDPAADTYGEYITRSGAVVSPAVPNDEPLRLEVSHFLDCVASSETPRGPHP